MTSWSGTRIGLSVRHHRTGDRPQPNATPTRRDFCHSQWLRPYTARPLGSTVEAVWARGLLEEGRIEVGRRLDVDWLVTSAEIRRLLGVKHTTTVYWWIDHDYFGFPEPVVTIGADQTRLWYWPEVATWAIKEGRLPEGADQVSPKELLPHSNGTSTRARKRRSS